MVGEHSDTVCFLVKEVTVAFTTDPVKNPRNYAGLRALSRLGLVPTERPATTRFQ